MLLTYVPPKSTGLEEDENYVVWVNPMLVKFAHPSSKGTTLWFDNKTSITVEEPIDEFADLAHELLFSEE